MTAPTIWPGKPVTCDQCQRPGIPTMTRDGWLMPRHDRPIATVGRGESARCSGSRAPVDPVAIDMATRVEQSFVAAMPSGDGTVAPDHLAEVPYAKGLEPGEDVFG